MRCSVGVRAGNAARPVTASTLGVPKNFPAGKFQARLARRMATNSGMQGSAACASSTLCDRAASLTFGAAAYGELLVQGAAHPLCTRRCKAHSCGGAHRGIGLACPAEHSLGNARRVVQAATATSVELAGGARRRESGGVLHGATGESSAASPPGRLVELSCRKVS